jgi:hypothetical protein
MAHAHDMYAVNEDCEEAIVEHIAAKHQKTSEDRKVMRLT